MRRIKILCVHGVGEHPPGGEWEGVWKSAIRRSWNRVAPDADLAFDFVHYDEAFAEHDIGFTDAIVALGKLTASAWSSRRRSRPRPRGELSSSLRWTAGMVVQWVENNAIRRKTRTILTKKIESFKPDVICAHSLGSLVAYDTFTTPDTAEAVKGRIFVTLGSQIANPFIAGNFLAGRVVPLSKARHWYHLYNEEDAVFTAPIRLFEDNFTQLNTYFDERGFADHSASEYLSHPVVADEVWTRLLAESRYRGMLTASKRATRSLPSWSRPRDRRALLVGINEHEESSYNLAGCVNDVFLMSQELQSLGFEEKDIRVVLNDRATADGIRDRLEWLLGDVKGGDTRFLFYSGHGARLSSYGQGDVIDRRDETLVPHDFDWSPERSITDDDFYELYSQLPYDASFVAIFDCCHSGGLTRASSTRVRGLSPPDDIRHRGICWDADSESWQARSLGHDCRNKDFVRRFVGRDRTPTRRLGHASTLRSLSKRRFERRKKELSEIGAENEGPYMPLLLYACQEDELAFEHREANTSYGAFTYSLVAELKQSRESQGSLSYEDLMDATERRVRHLGYDQRPELNGPRAWISATIVPA